MGSMHALALAWAGLDQLDRAERLLVRALTTAVTIHHGGATAESLDALAVVAARQRRWAGAARTLAEADELRARTGIRRSGLVEALVSDVRSSLASELDPDTLLTSRQEAAALDLPGVAAGHRMRLGRLATTEDDLNND